MGHAAGEWDVLEAAWNAARDDLTQHWTKRDQRRPDIQWLADLRTYETLIERAGDELIAYARDKLS